MPKIWNKYSQKRNIGVSVPISTFMCLWANYIFPWWVSLFCWRKYVDRSWEYISRSQTHECGNWGWGRAIPRKGIYKRNCRCSVEHCSAKTQCWKFETNIPRIGIARPQSHFPHSCVITCWVKCSAVSLSQLICLNWLIWPVKGATIDLSWYLLTEWSALLRAQHLISADIS